MNRRDVLAGVLLAAIGIVAVLEGHTHRVGTLMAMETGYFPIVLGTTLVLLGMVIGIGGALGRHSAGEAAALPAPDWRGCGAIVAGLLLFLVFGAYAGLAPATFALVFVSAMGDRASTLRGALLLAAVLTLAAAIVFWYLLQVQFPLWRFWPMAGG